MSYQRPRFPHAEDALRTLLSDERMEILGLRNADTPLEHSKESGLVIDLWGHPTTSLSAMIVPGLWLVSGAS
ncbi:MAG: hypothetical protein KA354_03845 [Phycisphaerae bacterium]|nr:hypothetical protein [Phycisphaerae bacterium]